MKPSLEEDRIPARPIVLAIIATIVITIASLFWVRAAMGPLEEHDRGEAAPAEVGGPSAIDQTLYGVGASNIGYAAPRNARARLELSRWAWIDRSAGLARIPIERAMQLVVDENQTQKEDRK